MIFGFIAKIYRKYQEYIHPGIYVTRHGILYREKDCRYNVFITIEQPKLIRNIRV